MASILIYPETEAKKTAKRLAKHIDAKIRFMYKTSPKEPMDLSRYDVAYIGVSLSRHKHSNNFSNFINSNASNIQRSKKVLFSPLPSLVDIDSERKFIDDFMRSVAEWKRIGNEKTIVCSLTEKDENAARLLSSALNVRFVDLKNGDTYENSQCIIVFVNKKDFSISEIPIQLVELIIYPISLL